MLSRELSQEREAVYEEMLTMIGRVPTIAEATRSDATDQADPDRDHSLIRRLESRVRTSGSGGVAATFDRWGVTLFRFFIQQAVLRKLKANGRSEEAMKQSALVLESRQELRAIATQLERQVSDELRS
jgi:hypothetical protein